jgi:hypothetical protein
MGYPICGSQPLGEFVKDKRYKTAHMVQVEELPFTSPDLPDRLLYPSIFRWSIGLPALKSGLAFDLKLEEHHRTLQLLLQSFFVISPTRTKGVEALKDVKLIFALSADKTF